MRERSGPVIRRWPPWLLLAAGVLAVCAAAAVTAQGAPPLLSCGAPVTSFLSEGGTQTFHFAEPAGTVVLIQSADISGGIGLMRLDATGTAHSDTTCSGSLRFVSDGGETTVEVADCFPENGHFGSGDFALTMTVVSGGTRSCAAPIGCGATSDGLAIEVPGEVDSFSFEGEEDDRVTLAATDLDGDAAPLRLRLFDPSGRMVGPTTGCPNTVTATLAAEGQYTALVSPCQARSGRYRLSLEAPGCPEGPTITYFGIASADGTALFPSARDGAGRPVYTRLQGFGLNLVVEGRPGISRRGVGFTTVGDPLPDMQMLVSRALGDGDPTVCDILPPLIGGVAATPDLEFETEPEVDAAINDLGCRFDDGQGNALGREMLDACTRSNEGFGFDFVDRTTSVQYCAAIAQAWAFPIGDTVVAARLRDRAGTVGMRREIVVRIAGDETRTPTPTRTRTRTPASTATRSATATATRAVTAGTPTPSPTPFPGCPGDCDDNDVVMMWELITSTNIALGHAPGGSCPGADVNSDGRVSIDDLVHGVNSSLHGCGAAARR